MATVTIQFDTTVETLEDVLNRMSSSAPVVFTPEPIKPVLPLKGDDTDFKQFVLGTVGDKQTEAPDKMTGAPNSFAATIETEQPQTVDSAIKQFTKSDVDTDTDGLIWDERIHSGSKLKNADGRWKARKGLNAEVKATVTAELKALASPAGEAKAPPAPATATAPPPPPAGNPAGSETWVWPTLMAAVMAAIADENNPIGREDSVSAAKDLGLENFSLLSNRPDLFDDFAKTLGLVK